MLLVGKPGLVAALRHEEKLTQHLQFGCAPYQWVAVAAPNDTAVHLGPLPHRYVGSTAFRSTYAPLSISLLCFYQKKREKRMPVEDNRQANNCFDYILHVNDEAEYL